MRVTTRDTYNMGIHTYMQEYTHTYIYTYTHTYIHTYIHTRRNTYREEKGCGRTNLRRLEKAER